MYAVKAADEDQRQETFLASDPATWTWSRIAVDYSGKEVLIVYGRDGDIAHIWTESDDCR